MLVEFTVGNYRSFQEAQTFSMEATALKSSPQNRGLDENVVFPVEKKLNLLASAAVYGANASGKSNLIRAWKFLRDCVLNSARESQAGEEIEVEAFELSVEMQKAPSFFEIVFIAAEKRYRYGFEVTPKKVVKEWLYRFGARGETQLFLRDDKGIEVNQTSFKEGRGLEERVRPNALFLSVVAQFNGKIASSLLRWVRSALVVSGLDDSDYRFYTLRMLGDNFYDKEIKALVRNLDVHIQDFDLVQQDLTPIQQSLFDDVVERRPVRRAPRQAIETQHSLHNESGESVGSVTFDINKQESAGTQKLIYFAGLLILTLQNGRVLFVDELDARLHPLMTCAIIRLFNDKRTNPHNAQLIFTTHDTNLLANHLLRRDQIWFAEKDDFQASHLYSLAEFVDENGARARNDDNFERDYIQGRFGAIPFIGDLQKVLGEMLIPKGENNEDDAQ